MPPQAAEVASNYTEMGFAGLAAVLLFMVFKFITKEISGKLDNQYNIIVKLIESRDKQNDKMTETKEAVVAKIHEMELSINKNLSYMKGRIDGAIPKDDNRSAI